MAGPPEASRALTRAVPPYAALAPLYDALLGKRFFPSIQRTFEWLVDRYGIRFSTAADAACGTGNFVHYLCGYDVRVVYGIDRSPEMLNLAIRKNSGSCARFLLQDLADLQLPNLVDLITCHFDSLNYLLRTDDLLRALRCFHGNLNPTGCLIFDMISDHPRWAYRGPHVERVNASGTTVIRITCWDVPRNIQTASVSISRGGRWHRELHVQRGYPISTVIGLLCRAHFEPMGVHDYTTLGPATRRTPRAVYVAQK